MVEVNMDDASPEYNINSNINIIQAHATLTKPSGCMHRDKWYLLNSSAQKIWDQLDASSKAIILGGQTTPKPKLHPPCRTNLHDISAADFIQAQLHELCMGSNGNVNNDLTKDVTDNDKDNDADSNTLLALATKQSGTDLSPGDIQHVLSTTMSQCDPDNKDKNMHKVNMAHTYCIS